MHNGAYLNSVHFEAQADLKGATTSISVARTSEGTPISARRLLVLTNLYGATFGENADLRGAIFGKNTDLRTARFGTDANLSAATFGDEVYLREATFEGWAGAALS